MRKIAALTAAALLSSLALGPLFAADAPRKTPSPDVPAEKFYKNIQVFQGLPSTELMPAMNFMANSLGVKCSYCHVTNDTGRWPVERDDKAAKNKAREMIRMTREINKANFKGKLEVTCATCHHGSNDPVPTPPLPAESAAAHPAAPAAAPPAPPSVDAVLEKYSAAVGGREATGRVRNRELTGTFTGGDGEPHPIEIIQTSSGRYRSSVKVKEGSFTIAFNGTTGTSGGPSWNNPMPPDEVERIRARARLFPAADLKERFPALAVRGSEKVDGRDTWRVTARADGQRMSFWFDAESGLLLRTLQLQHTALGDIPEQADYSDYREVDGVKVPFTIRHTAPDRGDTVSATEIKQNVDVPESLFTAPAPETKP